MASPSTPDHHKNGSNIPKSHFQQTVCLVDWWLVKAEDDFQGRRLAVAGYTSRENQALRVFSSAPILQRYDVFTLETSDGICVILKGFINKDRTEESGFPSDVCNHFVFGFPSYWKEYDEKFIGKKFISGVNLLKKLSRPSAGECGQPHVDSREKDLGSEDKMDAKGMQKGKKTKSSAVPSRQKSDTVVNVIVSGSPEKESYVEDQTTHCLKKNMKPLSDSSFGGNKTISDVNDMDADDSQSHCSGGALSACHLYNKSRSKKATDNLRKVKLDGKSFTKASLVRDVSSSEEIFRSTKGRVRKHSMSSLEMKQKSNQTSARIPGGKKIKSNSSMGSENLEVASVDCEPGDRKNCSFDVSRLCGPTDKIKSSELDAGSVKYDFGQTSEIPNQDKDQRKVKTRRDMQKAKNKATRSLSTPAAADNQKDNVIADINSSSQKAKASDMKTRRGLDYETPNREKEKALNASPQSFSFNRSRSGRLLVPTLEFWRNQRAIYDADRTITGIEEGVHLEQPRKAQEKRRQLMLRVHSDL